MRYIFLAMAFFVASTLISTASADLIGIGKSYGLFTRQTLTSPWKQIPNSGNVVDIALMPNGTLLGVGVSHELWIRDNLMSPWKQIPNSGSVIAITVMPDGTIIGVGESHGLFTRQTLTSSWKQIPNSGNIIAVTASKSSLQSPLLPLPSPPPESKSAIEYIWDDCSEGIFDGFRPSRQATLVVQNIHKSRAINVQARVPTGLTIPSIEDREFFISPQSVARFESLGFKCESEWGVYGAFFLD